MSLRRRVEYAARWHTAHLIEQLIPRLVAVQAWLQIADVVDELECELWAEAIVSGDCEDEAVESQLDLLDDMLGREVDEDDW